MSAEKPPSNAAFGSGWPRCSSASSVAGQVSRRSRWNWQILASPEFVEALRRVDEDVTLCGQAGEEIDLMDERHVLHDQGIGLHDWLARADLLVIESTKGHDRRAHPLRSETREGLCVASLGERSDREEFSGGHDALAAAPMEANLEHDSP